MHICTFRHNHVPARIPTQSWIYPGSQENRRRRNRYNEKDGAQKVGGKGQKGGGEKVLGKRENMWELCWEAKVLPQKAREGVFVRQRPPLDRRCYCCCWCQGWTDEKSPMIPVFFGFPRHWAATTHAGSLIMVIYVSLTIEDGSSAPTLCQLLLLPLLLLRVKAVRRDVNTDRHTHREKHSHKNASKGDHQNILWSFEFGFGSWTEW